MIKRIFAITIIVFSSFLSKAQIDQLHLYERLFRVADSLHCVGYTFHVDSFTLERAHSLDQLHPSSFFEASTRLLAESRYYEAAFMYYLGKFRFQYYNAVNPKFQSSGDGALYSSLSYIVGEPIDLFLKINSSNFILVIKAVQHYCYTTQSEKIYFKKDNFNEIYNGLLHQYSKFAADIEQHQSTYDAIWKTERNLLEDNIRLSSEEYQKSPVELKPGLKNN